ncbi:hypothetical protein K1Y78_53430 [Streptomyces sp. tea 10]|nr:hypothetical protein [Streptomyces sp. tea 10]
MADAMTEGDAREAIAVHRQHGTTSSVLSFISDDVSAMAERLAWAAQMSEEDLSVLGSHAEGPFLAPGHKGAHAADLLTMPQRAAVDQLLEAAAGTLRRVLPDGPDRRVTAISLASAIVAVHNAYLRTWLHDPQASDGERLAAGLNRRIAWLCTLFGLSFVPGRPVQQLRSADDGAGPAPVVIIVPEGVDARDVAERTARSVYEALAPGGTQLSRDARPGGEQDASEGGGFAGARPSGEVRVPAADQSARRSDTSTA